VVLHGLPYGEELRATVGEPVAAEPLPSSPRSRVWRVGLRSGERVVVKQITDKGAAGSWGAGSGGPAGTPVAEMAAASAEADARFAREVAGLRRAGLPVPRAADGMGGGAGDLVAVAPAVVGVDAVARVMVLEFLEDREAPADWMPGYAEALARLHARGLAPAGAGDTEDLPGWRGPSEGDVEAFLRFAAGVGVPGTGGVEGELGGVVERLRVTGAVGLLHGDPCPGNDLWTAGGVRFVDFEQASVGNGLVELAYLRIGFPTCWCAMGVPGAAAAEVEGIYRETWRRVTGREVAGELVDACVGWLVRGDALVERAHRESVDHLARAVAGDFEWGYVSARERLAYRLGVVAGLAGAGSGLERVGRWCAELRERMTVRWPDLRPLPGADSRPR
jgi:hypothetical protein